jgi:ligand-binding sensor domain-containing protein
MISWKDRLNKRALILVSSLVLALVALALVIFNVNVNRSIDVERDREAAGARVDVEQRGLRPPSTQGMRMFVNATDVRSVAVYRGTTYLATSGGLVKLGDGSGSSARYTTIDGLPENDLTALAVFRERLFVGTATAGLISFDGNTFSGYTFVKPRATRISVLTPTESELLIGTMDGGLLEFDGERFTRRFNSTSGADFSRVTALLPYESRLYIGTQDQGLYIWREARVEHISESQGLPSPRVTGLVRLPSGLSDSGVIGVATDFGVVGLGENNQLKPINARPNITSIAVSGGRVWAGLLSGGVVEIRAGEDGSESRGGDTRGRADVAGLPSVPATVSVEDEKLWALTAAGAFYRDEGSEGPAFERVAQRWTDAGVLSAAHVTSLSLDGRGSLWIGYFDQGVDVIDVDAAERVSHLVDERVREINYLKFDRNGGRMLVATSMGLVAIDARLKQTVFTSERNGLINNSIAHISLTESAESGVSPRSRLSLGGTLLVLATAGGLTELDGARARSLTAFHGLASNHLYTSAFVGNRLFLGSLAGLVELEGLRVVRNYKTSNSRLSHDWVTALVAANGLLFVGTNGGGVDELLPTGEWIGFSEEVGRFEVNQNAMHFDGERVYVGTSDRGLLVYNTRDRNWVSVKAGLTSQNVTAVTTDDQYVYVGTTNGLVRIEKRILQ